MSRDSAVADCPEDLWPGFLKYGEAHVEPATPSERFFGRRRLTFDLGHATATFTVERGDASLAADDSYWLEILRDPLRRAEFEKGFRDFERKRLVD